VDGKNLYFWVEKVIKIKLENFDLKTNQKGRFLGQIYVNLETAAK